MARQVNHVVLIGTLLASGYVIEGASIADWANNFTRELNNNLNNLFQQINEQINEQVVGIQRSVEETIQNLPIDAQGNVRNTNSSSSIISIGNGAKFVSIIDGVSRTITSGRAPNGEPYVRDVVEKRIGDMLYYNETTLNPKTGATETIAWKINLAIPGAKPEIITDTKKDEK